jgi:hypothetical protein
MGLNGSETEREAIERFKDALVVARHKHAEREGVRLPLIIMNDVDGNSLNRIDGRDDLPGVVAC